MKRRSKKELGVALGSIFLIAALFGGGIYFYFRIYSSNKRLQLDAEELQVALRAATEHIVRSKEENDTLAAENAELRGETENLSEVLSLEQDKNRLFESQINDIAGVVGDISGTVGVLDKLSKTDRELLRKYSKVYFLSENYVPELLSVIDVEHIYDKEKPQQIHAKVKPFLGNLFLEAEKDSVELQVVSAYRSFGYQNELKEGYKVIYGAGTANQFSADQGYSEHQLGTAVDFRSFGIEDALSEFEKTAEFGWLTENAHRFGFVLSYPEGNAYYQFEPWHWRFVGKKLAANLHAQGKYFYDLTQREIDEYLVSLFD